MICFGIIKHIIYYPFLFLTQDRYYRYGSFSYVVKDIYIIFRSYCYNYKNRIITIPSLTIGGRINPAEDITGLSILPIGGNERQSRFFIVGKASFPILDMLSGKDSIICTLDFHHIFLIELLRLTRV